MANSFINRLLCRKSWHLHFIYLVFLDFNSTIKIRRHLCNQERKLLCHIYAHKELLCNIGTTVCEGRPPRQEFEYTRHGTQSLLCAFEVHRAGSSPTAGATWMATGVSRIPEQNSADQRRVADSKIADRQRMENNGTSLARKCQAH